MKLIAKTTIHLGRGRDKETKKTLASTIVSPGEEFDLDDNDEIERLTAMGAAERKTRKVADDTDGKAPAAKAAANKPAATPPGAPAAPAGPNPQT
jgi:hypothetical protein